jgi:hypothetical protein
MRLLKRQNLPDPYLDPSLLSPVRTSLRLAARTPGAAIDDAANRKDHGRDGNSRTNAGDPAERSETIIRMLRICRKIGDSHTYACNACSRERSDTIIHTHGRCGMQGKMRIQSYLCRDRGLSFCGEVVRGQKHRESEWSVLAGCAHGSRRVRKRR